jgi:hypothetical protein
MILTMILRKKHNMDCGVDLRRMMHVLNIEPAQPAIGSYLMHESR